MCFNIYNYLNVNYIKLLCYYFANVRLSDNSDKYFSSPDKNVGCRMLDVQSLMLDVQGWMYDVEVG